MAPRISDLISQADAARILGVSRARLSVWVQEARIPSVIVGGRKLVHRSKLIRPKPITPRRKPATI